MFDPYDMSEKCPTCEGTGKVICDHCRGLELEILPCYECESEGKIGCPDCEGSGFVRYANGGKE